MSGFARKIRRGAALPARRPPVEPHRPRWVADLRQPEPFYEGRLLELGSGEALRRSFSWWAQRTDAELREAAAASMSAPPGDHSR